MRRRWHPETITILCGLVAFATLAPVSHAGLTDSIKKKLKDKAAQKAEQATDHATDRPGQAAPAEEAPAPAEESGAKPPGESATPGEKVSAVSTKFDFVPGDKLLFFDDLKQDELGEFPSRWRLVQGNFEVVESEGERLIRCTSQDGRIRMKLPPVTALPEFWTLEFDFVCEEPMPSALTVSGLSEGDHMVWEATFPQGRDLAFRTGEVYSTTPLEGAAAVDGRHHVMLMARGTALKVYLDRQRMANVPEISAASGVPRVIEIRLWATTQPMITNIRFAEGCRPAKDMLAEGKLVTYGIRFKTGSDRVLPESAPVLRQIAAWMEANPNARLKVTGHTDNVGTAASNLDLSKRRAASVAAVLTSEFGIAAARFAAEGKGDTEALASNTHPEGRAMNRRVEFAKL